MLFLELSVIRGWLEVPRHTGFLANLFFASAKDGYYAWRKLMLLSCYKISDRVLLYLRWRHEDGVEVPLRVSYPALAETIGVNRTALYRAVADLKRQKLIREVDGVLTLSVQG